MSFDGERSPKRQRLESYSPASPPFISDTKPFVPPHTPPPSVRMSPSWQSQFPSSNQQQQLTSNGGTFPTPPSTAGFQSQMAGRGAGSETGGESERQTPASDYENSVRRDGDGDGDAEMADHQDGGDADSVMVDAEHRRTDHERTKGTGGANSASSSMLATLPLYRLPTDPIPLSQPHASQDMIQLYSLQRIQASVARRDPVTGEKINKLRKSYENKVKALGLEGRNKAQANNGELAQSLHPEFERTDFYLDQPGRTVWQVQKHPNGHGPQLLDSQATNDLVSKLDSALNMAPGRLPPNEYKQWQNILGLDDATGSAGGRTPVAGAVKFPPTAAGAIAKTVPAASALRSAPSSPANAVRPDRANKKRRYDDNSFEGYTGYEDDGYSTGGVDDASRRGAGAGAGAGANAAKRQKRKDFAPSSQNSPSFSGSANNNAVGVRSS